MILHIIIYNGEKERKGKGEKKRDAINICKKTMNKIIHFCAII